MKHPRIWLLAALVIACTTLWELHLSGDVKQIVAEAFSQDDDTVLRSDLSAAAAASRTYADHRLIAMAYDVVRAADELEQRDAADARATVDLYMKDAARGAEAQDASDKRHFAEERMIAGNWNLVRERVGLRPLPIPPAPR